MGRAEFDRMVGMLLTDRFFADKVFSDPQKVLSELGFSQKEIDTVTNFPQDEFKNLATTLDARLTRNKRTSSKQCFEDKPPS